MPIELQQKSDCSNRLSHNELPYPPLLATSSILKGLSLNRYPDSDYSGLSAALAKRCGVTAEEIVVANGSDECIRLVIDAFSKPFDRILIPSPTFSEYSLISRICYRTPVETVQKDLLFDLKAIAEEANAIDAAMIFICSPNNPTGAVIEESALRQLLDDTACTVILDEAYIEFSQVSLSLLFKEYKELVVLRTLSKAYGLAGIRLGYCVAQPEMIRRLTAVRAPYAVSSLTASIALEALNSSLDPLQRTAEIIARRDWLMGLLRRYAQINIYESQANFVLIDCKAYFSLLTKALSEKGLQLRLFAAPELKNHLRITIGDASSAQQIVETFMEVFT